MDVIDYCHRTLTRHLGARSSHSGALEHPQLRHLDLCHVEDSITLRCIAILRYVAGHSDALSETVTSRMLTTTDVPALVVELMQQRPWLRPLADGRYQLYDNGQWRSVDSDQQVHYSGRMHPVEAHLWLLLLSLLMNPVASFKYQLNDHRCRQLLKVIEFLAWFSFCTWAKVKHWKKHPVKYVTLINSPLINHWSHENDDGRDVGSPWTHSINVTPLSCRHIIAIIILVPLLFVSVQSNFIICSLIVSLFNSRPFNSVAVVKSVTRSPPNPNIQFYTNYFIIHRVSCFRFIDPWLDYSYSMATVLAQCHNRHFVIDVLGFVSICGPPLPFFTRFQIVLDAGDFISKTSNSRKLVSDMQSTFSEIFKVLDAY